MRAGAARVMIAISYSVYSRVDRSAARQSLPPPVDAGQLLVAEAAVHQQPDQVRVGGERAAVGVVGGQEHAPRVPISRNSSRPIAHCSALTKFAVAVAERHDAAAGVALDVHAPTHLLGLREAGVAILAHACRPTR